jgi:hypothetical protein
MFGDFTLGTSGDMFSTLPNIGWCKCGGYGQGCRVGAVASNPEHVAFVKACSGYASGDMTLHGANQMCETYGGCLNGCGCDNVNETFIRAKIGDYAFFHPTCC